ncbi:MAG: hypothetical protein U0570_06875 [Phycisphaerales bacterium]
MSRTRFGLIAIDLHGAFVRMLQLARTGAEHHVHAWSVFPRLDSKSELASEIHRILGVIDRRGFNGRALAICLPDEHVLSAVLDLPPAKSGAPVQSIAGAEIGRMFKHAPDQLELACWELPAASRQAGAAASMVMACPHNVTDQCAQLFEAHDFDLRVVEPRAMSLARVCGSADEMQVLIALGWNQTRFYAVCSGAIVLERVIENADLQTLHRVVAGTIGLDTDLAATALKDALRAERELLTDPDAAREVQDQIRHFVELLTAESLTALSYLSRRFAGRKPARLLLACDGEEAPDLAREIGQKLALDARVCSIADYPITDLEPIDPASRRALAAAAGLCLGHGGGTW